MVEELKHNVEDQEVHSLEFLVSMRNLVVPLIRVISTAIWCISWRHNAVGCTHPWRVYVVPHGPICIRVPLHWVLTMMFFLWQFHLVSIQVQSRIWFLLEIDFD